MFGKFFAKVEIVGFGFKLPVGFEFKLFVKFVFKVLVGFEFKLKAYIYGSYGCVFSGGKNQREIVREMVALPPPVRD